MPEKDDHLSNEVSMSAKLEENGLKASVKSRTVSAVDRLLGAAIDLPTAWLEGKAEGIRERPALLRNKETTSLPAPSDKPLVLTHEDKIKDAALARETRKVLNKREVLEHAVEDLAKTTNADQNEGQSEDQNLDEDWLNYFEEYAEKASTERVRKLWGRVLAGEIRTPKTYSLRALRFLSELDTHTALLFERLSRKRLYDWAITEIEKLSGQNLLDAMELEEAGLLQSASTGLTQTLNADDNGKILIMSYGYLLQLKPKNEKTCKLPLIKISKIGQELLTLLDPPPAKENLTTYLDHLIDKNEITWGILAQITGTSGDKVKFNILRSWEMPKT
ncbi:MAG: DUF2806 domain-containing protein [Sulfitobacter sp.]